MKNGIRLISFLLPFLMLSCSSGPVPFNWGKDNCQTCKMTIMDPKFGAELVSKKGKVFKFDDVTCLQHFLKSGTLPAQEIRHQVVINFEKENDFLDLNQAIFLVSPGIKSPMGSQAAAFSSREAAEKYNSKLQGNLFSWTELADKLQ